MHQTKHTMPVLFQTANQWASNSPSRTRQQNSHFDPPTSSGVVTEHCLRYRRRIRRAAWPVQYCSRCDRSNDVIPASHTSTHLRDRCGGEAQPGGCDTSSATSDLPGIFGMWCEKLGLTVSL